MCLSLTTLFVQGNGCLLSFGYGFLAFWLKRKFNFSIFIAVAFFLSPEGCVLLTKITIDIRAQGTCLCDNHIECVVNAVSSVFMKFQLTAATGKYQIVLWEVRNIAVSRIGDEQSCNVYSKA